MRVTGTDINVMLTGVGWRGCRVGRGRRRGAMLTTPCETPEQVVEALIRHRYVDSGLASQ